jgi:lipopolysaccharide exporter
VGKSPGVPSLSKNAANPVVAEQETAIESGPGTTPPEAHLAYRAVRGGLWVALSSYWTIAFGFLSTIVLTRLLSPEAFGSYAYATFFAQFLTLSPKLGLNYAFIQHKETTDEALGTYVTLEVLAALGGLLVTFLAMPFLPSSVALICVVLAASGVAGLGGIGAVLLEKELKLGRTSLIQSIVIPVSYLPAFFLAAHGGGAWSLVAQVVTQSILSSAVLGWAIRSQLGRIISSRKSFTSMMARRFLGLGIATGLSLFAGVLLTSLDNYFIGTFVGAATLGFYDRAYRTAQWPSTLLTNMISRTSLYTYAKLQDDRVRLQKATTMVLWMISLLALPMALAIFIAAPDLVTLLYGERWLPSVPYLRILVLISALRPLWENACSLFVAIGKARITLTLTLIQVLTLAAAGLPMTIAWGAMGACLAVASAFGIGMIIIYYALTHEIPLKLSSVFGVPILVSVLTVLGYMALNRMTPLNGLSVPVRVGIKGSLAITAYFGFTLMLQPHIMRERVAYIWRLLKGTAGGKALFTEGQS